MSNEFSRIVDATINCIRMNEKYLLFYTDKGVFVWAAMGDCCSVSYFHDFLGVKKLLAGNPITETYEIDSWEVTTDTLDINDVTVAYGYGFVTEDPIFGPVTSVLAFRNDSNGYYEGSLEYLEGWGNNKEYLGHPDSGYAGKQRIEDIPIISADVLGD